MAMSTDITKSTPIADAQRLGGLAEEVLRLAAAAGASQALITITAVDAEGRPKTVPLRADISIDGIVQDYGRLSTKQPVTNGSPLA